MRDIPGELSSHSCVSTRPRPVACVALYEGCRPAREVFFGALFVFRDELLPEARGCLTLRVLSRKAD